MANQRYPGEGFDDRGDSDARGERRYDRDMERDRSPRGGMMFSDDDDDFRSRDRDRGGEDRGFFERAGETVRGWFSDDDDDGRSRGSFDRQRESGWGRGDDHQPQGWGVRTPEDERYRSQQGRGRGSDDRGEWFGGRDRGEQFAGRDRDDSGTYTGMGSSMGGFGNQEMARPADQGLKGRGGFGSSQDDHYRSWRDRQISELDRDYSDYCREREQRFHSDFDSWRKGRQGQGSQAGDAGPSGIGATGESGGKGQTAETGGFMMSGRDSESGSESQTGSSTASDSQTGGESASPRAGRGKS